MIKMWWIMQNKATDELLEKPLHFETKNFIHNYLINSWLGRFSSRMAQVQQFDSAIASGKSNMQIPQSN
jgi:hypothetical protein